MHEPSSSDVAAREEALEPPEAGATSAVATGAGADGPATAAGAGAKRARPGGAETVIQRQQLKVSLMLDTLLKGRVPERQTEDGELLFALDAPEAASRLDASRHDDETDSPFADPRLWTALDPSVEGADARVEGPMLQSLLARQLGEPRVYVHAVAARAGLEAGDDADDPDDIDAQTAACAQDQVVYTGAVPVAAHAEQRLVLLVLQSCQRAETSADV